MGGEGLARGPVEVLGTLLHEAAHAVAHVRGIKDTSLPGPVAQRAGSRRWPRSWGSR